MKKAEIIEILNEMMGAWTEHINPENLSTKLFPVWKYADRLTEQPEEVSEIKAMLHQFGIAFSLLSEALGGDFNQITPAGESAMDVVNRMLNEWALKFSHPQSISEKRIKEIVEAQFPMPKNLNEKDQAEIRMARIGARSAIKAVLKELNE